MHCNFSHEHFALAKPHSSLSTVVPMSIITAINEAVKNIINNDVGPDDKETLVALSLMNQTDLSIGLYL